MTEQILFLTKPEYTNETISSFRFKVPPLSMDRNAPVMIELLQCQLLVTNFLYVTRGGLVLKLKTTASNYVGTDNKDVCLGLLRTTEYLGTGQITGYKYTQTNGYKVMIPSNPDYLDFDIYTLKQEYTGSPSYIKMILKVTHPPVSLPPSLPYKPDQILYIDNFEFNVYRRAHFRCKLPPLNMDNGAPIMLELLQCQMILRSYVMFAGAELRLMNSSDSYVGSDNKGISLCMLDWGNYYGTMVKSDYYYAEESPSYKIKISGNPDYLEFQILSLTDVITFLKENDDNYISMIFRITYPDPEEYRREIPLPSRLL